MIVEIDGFGWCVCLHFVRSGWGRMGQLRSPPGPRLCALRGAGRFPQHGAQFCSVSTASCAPTTEMKYRRTCCPAEILRLTSVQDTVVKVTFYLRGVTTATPQDQDFLRSENRSRLPCAALSVCCVTLGSSRVLEHLVPCSAVTHWHCSRFRYSQCVISWFCNSYG